MSGINEGDRVRITKDIRWSGVDAGALGTVTEMCGDGSAFVKIDGYTPDNMFGGAIAVGSDQMEKVEDVDFKQGDKVRVVKSFAPQAIRVGDQGVVKELSDDGRFVRVVMDGSNNGYAPFRRDEIELVKAPAFKVGDRVKLVRKTDPGVYVPLGTKGTVIQDTYVDDTYDGRVDFDDEFYQWVKWDQIELIQDPTFKAGDKVKVLNNQEPARAYVRVGAIGTLVSVPEDPKRLLNVRFGQVDATDSYFFGDFTQVLSREQLELVGEDTPEPAVEEEKTVLKFEKVVAEPKVAAADPRDLADFYEDVAAFLRDAADLKDREEELRDIADELGVTFL